MPILLSDSSLKGEMLLIVLESEGLLRVKQGAGAKGEELFWGGGLFWKEGLFWEGEMFWGQTVCASLLGAAMFMVGEVEFAGEEGGNV
jgi:hypothetical protein